jgi:alpha-beta hydrolase superfamily lysophospholipase
MRDDLLVYDIPMHGYVLHASYFGPRNRTALMLHGGGNTASADIFPLRVDLAERGIGTLALDHRGHGKTGGQLADSSLAQRVDEARAAVEAVRPQDLLGAVSMSMGGYVAVQLTRVIELRSLAMIAPAMYDAEAFDMPFGPSFSAIIRRSESWRPMRDVCLS